MFNEDFSGRAILLTGATSGFKRGHRPAACRQWREPLADGPRPGQTGRPRCKAAGASVYAIGPNHQQRIRSAAKPLAARHALRLFATARERWILAPSN